MRGCHAWWERTGLPGYQAAVSRPRQGLMSPGPGATPLPEQMFLPLPQDTGGTPGRGNPRHLFPRSWLCPAGDAVSGDESLLSSGSLQPGQYQSAFASECERGGAASWTLVSLF